MGATSNLIMADSLTPKEVERGSAIFKLMDADDSGTVEIEEICIVHDSDRESMLRILDEDGNGQVSDEEWLKYLGIKKGEKGKKKFQFFLNYLEQEVPKNLPKLEEIRAAKAEAPAVSAGAPAAAASPQAGNRVLKGEFAKAVEVFEPPSLGLKDHRIKDAFTNLMFAIQDLDAAVGRGTQ